MALAQEKIYTADFIETLPEDVRAELIDGQLFYMTTPTTTHQGLLSFLHGTIWGHIREQTGSCKVYPAPLAVYLNKDNLTYPESDIIVICDQDKMKEMGCFGAPDFVAEIVSPSTQSRDYLLKLNKYQTAGVREYWILDTERATKPLKTDDFCLFSMALLLTHGQIISPVLFVCNQVPTDQPPIS